MTFNAAIKAYLITDPSYYGDTPDSVYDATEEMLRIHRPEFACFRDKSTPRYAELAEAFVEAAKEAGCCTVLLHGDAPLAHRLGADGVHLTSRQYGGIHDAKARGLYVIASCHSLKEIGDAAEAGADAVTYSPIFASPGKGIPKGLEDLKEIVGKIDLNIFALGGITTPEQLEQVAVTGVYGFASIRYFV
jgi:thiamine-phosphate pyrophosphorylase